MSRKLTQKEFDEIENLVESSISAYNKKGATSCISRLRFMSNTLDLTPNVRNMFSELVGYTEAASGQVREKEHWVSAARSALYKLKSFGLEREDYAND